MPIKIIVIVKSIDGGTGTFLLNFLKIKSLFKKHGVEIKTLVLERPTYRILKQDGFSYFRKKNYYPQRYSLSINNIIGFFKELIWIRKKIKSFKPQILFAIDMRCNLLAVLCKKGLNNNIKVIATNHIDLGKTILDKSTPVLNQILKFFIKLFYDQMDVLVGVSKHVSKSLKNKFNLKKQVITVYNGQAIVHTPPFHFNHKKKVIISVARLVEQKDHINLIMAIKQLSKKLPSTVLWILSDGPKRKFLENFVKKQKLTNNIKFLGWVKNINYYFKKADLFVLSSKREGFAYVLVEAMSQGLPVISTDTPYGPREVLDNGKYGLLVPMKDPDSLSNAILKIIRSKKIHDYYAKKSIIRSKYFSIEKMLINYNKIIVNLIKTNP